MGVFSTLATLFLFGVTQVDDFKKKDESDRNREMAKEHGLTYYLDGHGKTRSCETDELVYVFDGDPIRKVVGVKSGRVYYYYDKRDEQYAIHEKSLREENERLERWNKKYRVLNIEKWNRSERYLGRKLIKFDRTYLDLENGKKIYSISKLSNGEYLICYIDESKSYKTLSIGPDCDQRFITEEEYEKYYCPVK